MMLDVFNVIQNVALDWDFGRVFLKLGPFVVYLYSAVEDKFCCPPQGFKSSVIFERESNVLNKN